MEHGPDTPLAKLLHFARGRAPRVLAPALGQASLDAAVLERRLLRGRGPSPLVDRGPRRAVHVPIATRAPLPAVLETPSSPMPTPAPDVAITLTIVDGDARTTCTPGADQYALHAALEAGAAMPFSCALGGCGSCKVRLVSGDYVMDEPHCLTDAERAEGYVLTCVGRARSACVLAIVR